MCGIVGLFSKNPEVASNLGSLFSPMLQTMGERGPDSAGFAIYRKDEAIKNSMLKLCLYEADETFSWVDLQNQLSKQLQIDTDGELRANHFILRTSGKFELIKQWLSTYFPNIKIVSAGERIEIYKEKGFPSDVVKKFHLSELSGSHAIGHTRMATESAVTTAHSHPFSTGLDLCLVHNGSLSNHNNLRRNLKRNGIEFQTDNDSEVAAGYFTYRLSQGDTLKQALEHGLNELDGFYTFALGTKNGFAVLRDPVACKPAVLAENDDWVAMASEFRALAHLPNIENANIWEPKPATVYSWQQH